MELVFWAGQSEREIHRKRAYLQTVLCESSNTTFFEGGGVLADQRPKRLVVAMTGTTGVILGIRFLEALNALGVETHLVMSEWAERNIRIETDYSVAEVRRLATAFYRDDNQAAPISSGSFSIDGMAIIPCSMNTLAHLAHGMADNLIVRAADVALKEGRKLVIVPRETPLNTIHLRNLLTLSEMGVSIVPPMPAFYNRPETIDDFIRHIVARALDQFGIDNDLTLRWGGAKGPRDNSGKPRNGTAVNK